MMKYDTIRPFNEYWLAVDDFYPLFDEMDYDKSFPFKQVVVVLSAFIDNRVKEFDEKVIPLLARDFEQHLIHSPVETSLIIAVDSLLETAVNFVIMMQVKYYNGELEGLNTDYYQCSLNDLRDIQEEFGKLRGDARLPEFMPNGQPAKEFALGLFQMAVEVYKVLPKY